MASATPALLSCLLQPLLHQTLQLTLSHHQQVKPNSGRVEKVGIPLPNTTAPKPKIQLSQGEENWFMVDDGEKSSYKNAVDVLVNSLRTLAQVSDEILPKIEKEMESQLAKRKVKVIKRRWIAQSKEALYQNPKLWSASVEVVPGWWLGTNYSNGDKRDMLAITAKVAAEFGVELKFYLI